MSLYPEPRTALITGATSGFGRAVAEGLARDGWRLFLVCRPSERAREAASSLAARAEGPEPVMLLADLSRISEVGRVAEEFLAHDARLDLLLNNAGSPFATWQLTEDGLERTVALNHLAYYQLTVRLAERLRSCAPSRVVNVASDAYTMAGSRFAFERYNERRFFWPHRQYGQSKLANILFTRQLARRLGDGVETLAWSPTGLTATRFGYGAHRFGRYAMALSHPFALSTEEAVGPLLELCRGEGDARWEGEFIQGRERPQLRASASSRADAERLWSMSAELTGVDL